MNNADDHMRMIKSTVNATFPNISGAITATHTQINAAVTAVVTDGVGKLADAGVFFKTSGDGFVNTLAGDIDVKLQGTIAATFQRTGGQNFFKITGQIEATTLKGAGMCPIGSSLIWLSDTLPPSDEGIFASCNGAAYSRTTFATCYARLGTTWGGGNGSTTFNVPNFQEVVLAGKSTMGGGYFTWIACEHLVRCKGCPERLVRHRHCHADACEHPDDHRHSFCQPCGQFRYR